MINSLRKVSIMYMCHNLNDTNIWDSLFEDLPKCVSPGLMPTQALVYVVRACFYSVLWSLHELDERGGDPAPLRERLLAYAAHCRNIVAAGATPDLKEEVRLTGLRPPPHAAPAPSHSRGVPSAGLHESL